jgi:putative Holliday junction resolvase
MSGRILGIDYGEKRVGIAWSDPFGLIAYPQSFLSNGPDLLPQIKMLINGNKVKHIVVGLPKNRFGQSTQQTIIVEKFVSFLRSQISIPVELINEAYSTQAATKQLYESGKNAKRQRQIIDSQAAAFFLQGYLDRMKSKNIFAD